MNEDGSVNSGVLVNTYNKASFAEGETASLTTADARKHGSDSQIFLLNKTQYTYRDKSGAVLQDQIATREFDEDGLQTSLASKATSADGTELSGTGEITWTKDNSGRPTSFKLVENTENGESMTYTGGVKVDESGVISEVSNVMAGDKLVIDKITIEHTKIENPLPNAYEGWKNFWITDYLILS